MAAIGADEKKKLMFLGGLIVLILGVVLYLFNPFGGDSTSEPAPLVAKSADNAAPAPAGRPPAPGGAPAAPPARLASAAGSAMPVGAVPAGAAGAAAGSPVARLINPAPWRQDPFAPPPPPLIYDERGRVVPTPRPIPIPTQLPPVPVPRPQVIAPPPTILPPFIRPGVGPTLASTAVLAPLPPVTIPQAPRVPLPPSGMESSQAGGQVGIARSSNKRLSGIIIGDGVRALLEIGTGEDKVTRIVQPGDDVDGMTILRVERNTEGARTTTRLIIREAGVERYVELRPSPEAATRGGEGGEAGAGGAGTPRRGMPRSFDMPAPP